MSCIFWTVPYDFWVCDSLINVVFYETFSLMKHLKCRLPGNWVKIVFDTFIIDHDWIYIEGRLYLRPWSDGLHWIIPAKAWKGVVQEGVLGGEHTLCPQTAPKWKQPSKWWAAISMCGNPPDHYVRERPPYIRQPFWSGLFPGWTGYHLDRSLASSLDMLWDQSNWSIWSGLQGNFTKSEVCTFPASIWTLAWLFIEYYFIFVFWFLYFCSYVCGYDFLVF